MNLMRNIIRIKQIIIKRPGTIISCFVFLFFWLINRGFTGPAYISDEIGYLAKAAVIAGYNIDGANSWHAGSSFILAPLFKIFSEPTDIWQAAMILNSMMWAVTFYFLTHIIYRLYPNINRWRVFTAILITAAYPAWVTMAGYVFSTTVFVFFYLLSILLLLQWKTERFWTIIPHSIAVAYLYWIHPIGLAVCIASTAVVSIISIKANKYSVAIINVVIIAGLILFYRGIVEEWITIISTPEGYESWLQHYPDVERLVSRMYDSQYWRYLFIRLFGHVAYLIVGSLGMVLFGARYILQNMLYLLIGVGVDKKNDNKEDFQCNGIFSLMGFSLFGVMAIGIIGGGTYGIDKFIYGRYNEMVLLPILAVGYLSYIDKKWLWSAVFIVVMTGILLNHSIDTLSYNNLINTISFWPQYIVHENNYFYWMLIGAIFVTLTNLLKDVNRVGKLLSVTIMLFCFIIAAINANSFHHEILAKYSKPSPFVEIIRASYPKGTCVGFNPIEPEPLLLMQNERYNLNLFYLYDYSFRRMTPEEWLNGCIGPYLSFQLSDLYLNQSVALVGIDIMSELYLLTKVENGIDSDIFFDKAGNNEYHLAVGWEIKYSYKYTDNRIRKLSSQVGSFGDSFISSTGKEGLLVFGPYIKVPAGDYNLIVYGNYDDLSNYAYIEITSDLGVVKHAEFAIDRDSILSDGTIINVFFTLNNPVDDLEIRLYVYPEDIIQFDGYEIITFIDMRG